MLFKNIKITNEKFDIVDDMYVGISDGRIKYIGKEMPQDDFGEEYDGHNKLLMPSFTNAHAHLPMSCLRGYGENLSLMDWLNTKIFPFEDRLKGDDVYWSTLLSIAESLQFGITSSSDMYYFCEDVAKAVLESGAKANISRSITNFEDKDLFELESFREMMDLYDTYHNAEDEKVKIDFSLHAEYTSTPKTVYQLAEITRKTGVNMHVHVSETAFEHEECKKKYGMTPVEYMAEKGLFDTPTTAAHCVWIEGDDYDILKDKGVTVASNPISNLKLASGICNIPALMEKGINVAIGTDGSASNNNLNMLEEIKAFALLSKEKFKNPTLITPQETLYAATYAGAKSQGRWDTGRIEEGNRADLIVLDLSKPHMHPVFNLATNIVYSACSGDIVMTMADGKILYKDGEFNTIDIERVIFEVEKSTGRILKELESKDLVARK